MIGRLWAWFMSWRVPVWDETAEYRKFREAMGTDSVPREER